MAKVKADPFAVARDKIVKLGTHLEKVKNQISSGTVPPRQKLKASAYKEWLKLEFKRTSKRLEELKLSLPAGK